MKDKYMKDEPDKRDEKQANTAAQAGQEGERAVEAQLENGGIWKHKSYSDPMKGEPTGMEK